MKLVKNGKGVYHVHFRTEKGRRVLTTNCKDKDEAQQVVKQAKVKELELAARASKLNASTISQLTAGRKLSLSTAAEEWFAHITSTKSPRTTEGYKLMVSVWLRRMKLEDLALGSLKPAHVADYINRQGKGKVSTRRLEHTVLALFVEWCRENGWIGSNPANLAHLDLSKFSHKQKEKDGVSPLTPEQIQKLIDNTSGFYRTAIIIARYTGLRIGDIINLEWSVFSKPGVIAVWTDKRDRRVEIPLVSELALAVSAIPLDDEKYCFPEQRRAYLNGQRSKFSVYFSRLFTKCGIEGHSIHDLRATFASDCIRKGIALPHVVGLIGHMSEKTTLGYIKEALEGKG